jgi:hypothetical protein
MCREIWILKEHNMPTTPEEKKTILDKLYGRSEPCPTPICDSFLTHGIGMSYLDDIKKFIIYETVDYYYDAVMMDKAHLQAFIIELQEIESRM